MRKTALGVFVIFALATLVWASDPWKSKPYQQWDKDDVRKILTDSPWSKVIPEDANWRGFAAPSGLPGGSDAGRGGGGGGEGGGGGRPGGGGGAAAQGGGASGGAGGGMGSAGGISQVPFSVRWVSSQTIREALVRSAELRGQMTPAQAQSQLAAPTDVYEVMVAALQMNPFEGVDEKTLKQKTVLEMKKSKAKVQPSKVEIQRSPDGKRIEGVVFSFPKKADNGEATISPEEKEVQFMCQIPELDLRAKFDLSKMTTQQGRDL
ncbi:MAG TPA: hypothetical protein VN661_13245 [Candidatus Acidoferrales bacterium]|nr:hypothetical protein [Candidatus Acidoferrales bacterium]